MYTSRVGHVGPNVLVEIPTPDAKSQNPDDKKPFAGHPDLKEIADWEYLKLHADFKEYGYARCFRLPARET